MLVLGRCRVCRTVIAAEVGEPWPGPCPSCKSETLGGESVFRELIVSPDPFGLGITIREATAEDYAHAAELREKLKPFIGDPESPTERKPHDD